jgi:hypothetical protein
MQMNEQEYLEKNVFYGLKNLNYGFDALSIKYFSQKDFEIVLCRIEKLGLGIYGIEPWSNGSYFDVSIYQEYSNDPSDPNWYKKAFNKFVKLDENLQYSATYHVPEELLRDT